MGVPTIAVRHGGRRTVATVPGDRERIARFRDVLLRDEFYVESETESVLTLGRKIRLMRGDWPMRVRIERAGEDTRISYFLFTPWSWIVAFSILVFVFLPFIPLRGAPLVFLLGVGVIGVAVYKQKLDLSPTASWQGPPRKQWNDKMNRLLSDIFGGVIRETK